jgi:hypothetical protein
MLATAKYANEANTIGPSKVGTVRIECTRYENAAAAREALVQMLQPKS